jgi:hypothetical protein
MILWIITVIISWLLLRLAIKLHGIAKDGDDAIVQLLLCTAVALIPAINIIAGIVYLIVAFFISRGLSAREWITLIFMTDVDWKSWFKKK